MDYLKTYNDIITKAKEEDKYGKRSIGYFEKHHIQPKSLGGNNDKENLIKLTAREHFICHWLLVKIYRKGSEERNKMLCALWRMRSNPTNENERYNNARAYEKLRIEFSQIISDKMSIMQRGESNSQYGTKWYTNYITGESHKFKIKPNDTWIYGRNLFKNETCIIPGMTKYVKNLKETRDLWNRFHSGKYESLNEFAKEIGCAQPNLSIKFKRYIPIYEKIVTKRFDTKSNKDLINVYE